MKLTTNTNIGGCAFTIDQDAYSVLEEYLNSIEAHLQASDSKDEIMQDIELRIAELFNEHLKFSHMEVVNLTMVNDIKVQLGTPETIGGDQDDSTSEAQTDSIADETAAAESEEPTQTENVEPNNEHKKKLYRDVDNQKIGGVCSGIARYFGIDPIWFRLAFTLAFFFYGSGFLAYLLLWFIMPAANTSSRRLEMQGIEPTAENIQQEVERQQTEGKSEVPTKKNSNGCLTTLLVILALTILSPLLIVLGWVFFSLIVAIGGIFASIPSIGTSIFSSFGATNAWMAIFFLLVILIPIIAIIIWVVNRSKKKETHTATWIIAAVLWIASIIGCTVASIQNIRDAIKNHSTWEWSWSSIRNDETGEIDEEALSDTIVSHVSDFINVLTTDDAESEE